MLPGRSNEKALAEKEEGAELIVEEDSNFFLKVPGIAITDCFNVVGEDKQPNPRIYIMAVPFIGGFNPDYSGLDFCAEAAGKVIASIFNTGQ